MPRRSIISLALLLCAGSAQAQLEGYNPIACSIQYERTGYNELMQLCRSNPDGGVATGFRSGSSSIRCNEAQAWAAQCGWPYKAPPPLPAARTAARQEPARAPAEASSALLAPSRDGPADVMPGYDMRIIGGFRPYDEPLVIDPPRDLRRRATEAARKAAAATPPARDETGARCISLSRHASRYLGEGLTETILVMANSPRCKEAIAVWARGSDGSYRSATIASGGTGQLACVTNLGATRPCYGLVEWGEGAPPAD